MTKQPRPLWALALCLLLGVANAAERSVTVSPFSSLAIARELKFPARVINLKSADIAAETSGRIVRFPLQVGDRVEAGQLLLEIDCQSARIDETRIRAGLKRLQAARELTIQQLERARRLVKSSSISREELDQRQTQLNADEASIEEQNAQLEAARVLVQRCRLNAPFSGIITHKFGQTGAYAMPGTPQLTLLKEDEVEVQLDLPGVAVARLKEAPEIHFSDHLNSYPVEIRSVLPQVDGQSLQRRIRLRFLAKETALGGSYGQIIFSTPRHYLPASYIQKRDGRFGVFILQAGVARFHALDKVEEGQPAATRLTPETLIITSSLQLLNDQDSVTVQH